MYKDTEKLEKYVNKLNTISDFQRELLLIGFPYALEVDENNFEEIKEYFLVNDTDGHDYKNPETERYIGVLIDSFKVYNRTHSILDECKKHGDVVLLSNFYGVLKPIFPKLFTKKEFSQIVLSCNAGKRKPSSDFLNEVQNDGYERKIYVGDNWYSDMVPALIDNFKCVYVNPSDVFIQYILKNGIQSLIQKDDKYHFKSKYKEMAKYFLGSLIDIDDILESDIYIEDSKVFLTALKNVIWYPSIDDIKEIREII